MVAKGICRTCGKEAKKKKKGGGWRYLTYCTPECRKSYAETAKANRIQEVLDTREKACSRCKTKKSVDDFHIDTNRLDGYFPYCKECRREYDGRNPFVPSPYENKNEYMKAYRGSLSTEEKRKRRRAKHLWAAYRLSVEEYTAIAVEQGYKCAICEVPCDPETETMSVDHDHTCCPYQTTCGKCIRGLLCLRCNSALGMLQDDVEILKRAINYLKSDDTNNNGEAT